MTDTKTKAAAVKPAASETTPASERENPGFYKKPELLHAAQHGDLRLTTKPGFHFAAHTNAAPIMAAEFAPVARHYPIVFAGDPVLPFAVLGMDKDNLFVNDKGDWEGNSIYIPAFVRQYPFCFIQTSKGYSLAIDTASERVVREDKGERTSRPLFVEGEPAPVTHEALRFCGILKTDHDATRAFAAALAEQGLLVEQQAVARSVKGRQYQMGGFRVVDVAKFQALSDAVVLEWHRKGWLGLVHNHIASLMSWRDLLVRAGDLEVSAPEPEDGTPEGGSASPA